MLLEFRRVLFRSDRKSTTSELQSHSEISYAVFCLKKKKRHGSEEHTSELQSHSEISYADICLKKKKTVKDKELKAVDMGKYKRTVDLLVFFFFNDTATTEIYTNLNTLSLHDALPIFPAEAAIPLAPFQPFLSY